MPRFLGGCAHIDLFFACHQKITICTFLKTESAKFAPFPNQKKRKPLKGGMKKATSFLTWLVFKMVIPEGLEPATR
jgi:hypothetical protein